MNAYSFSSEVLDRIVSYITEEPADDLEEWKQRLELLVLNRQWRSVATPHVLSQLFFASPNDYDDQKSDDSADIEAELHSNIDLIAACPRPLAKSVNILAEGPINVITCMSNIVSLLGSSPLMRNSIQALSFNFILDELSASNDGYGSRSSDAAITSICNKMVGLLPNINKIEILSSDAGESGALFIGQLVDLYAQNLCYLDCPFPLSLMSPQFSDKLVHLGVVLDEFTEVEFPSVCSNSLEYLSLGSLTSKTIWRSFRGLADSKRVLFGKLKQLSITFNDSTEKSIGAPQSVDAKTKRILESISFPALSKLNMTLCPSACDIFELFDFPLSLQTLRIICPAGGIVSLSDAMFDSDTRRSISKHIRSDNIYKDVLQTTNFLLSKPLAKHASLHLDFTVKIPDNSVISWEKLTELTIDSEISSAWLLRIIPELSELTVICASNVTIEDSATSETELNVKNADWALLPPLQTKLQHLSLCFNNTMCSGKLSAALVKNMAARIPSLKSIEILYGLCGLDVFAKDNSVKLPHLESVHYF